MDEYTFFPKIRAAGLTDIGKSRPVNQDLVFCSTEPVGVLPNLFVVADGMGGHKAGDLASSEAVRSFVDYIEDHSTEADDIVVLMKTSLALANRYVYYLSKESDDYQGMGTTFVAATIVGHKLYCINVGDSRLYTVNRPGERPMTLERVTEDHSIVEMLLKEGIINEEQARNHPQKNMVTRAVGIDEKVEIDDFCVDTTDLTKVLICSDGLTNMVTDIAILNILTSGRSVEETAAVLIDRANENGGRDNISAVVIDLNGEDMSNA